MNLETYREEVKRTVAKLDSRELDILHMKLGIATEVGELYDIFKKHIAYGKELDLVHLQEELGDICFYVANHANFINAKLTDEDDPQITYAGDSLHEVISDLLDVEWNYLDPHEQITLVMQICDYFGLDFEKTLEKNINKLRARYKESFSVKEAINRDVKNERQILEK